MAFSLGWQGEPAVGAEDRLLQDPWLALPRSLTDTAVAAFTLGAAPGARLLFRWD